MTVGTYAATVERVRSFGQLEENWNDEGAAPINPEYIERALKALPMMEAAGFPPPYACPGVEGEVELEWRTEGGYYSILFDDEGMYTSYFEAYDADGALYASDNYRDALMDIAMWLDEADIADGLQVRFFEWSKNNG